MSLPSFDVLIVGGGLVGNSLALALANHARVAVVESKTIPSTQTISGLSTVGMQSQAGAWERGNTSPLPNPLPKGEGIKTALTHTHQDHRALVLAWGSRLILETLSVWNDNNPRTSKAMGIEPHTTPIQTIHVSEAGRFGANRFHASEYAVAALGYTVKGHHLTQILQQAVLNKSTLSLFHETTLQHIASVPGGYQVTVQTSTGLQTIFTRLLVGADGAQSRTRTLLGIDVKQADYAQTALTAQVTLKKSHENTAYQRFTSNGVLAALPLKGNQAGIVWTIDAEQANELKALSDSAFCERFHTLFGHRLGRFLEITHRQSHPLQSFQALEQIRPHAILLGNAAHTVYPVAAQGFNLGLRDVAALSHILLEALTSGKNPGDVDVLQGYIQSREFEQSETAFFTRNVVEVFSKETLLWKWIRSGARCSLEHMPLMKKKMAQRAMGL